MTGGVALVVVVIGGASVLVTGGVALVVVVVVIGGAGVLVTRGVALVVVEGASTHLLSTQFPDAQS